MQCLCIVPAICTIGQDRVQDWLRRVSPYAYRCFLYICYFQVSSLMY